MKAAVQHFMCMMSVIRLALLRDIFFSTLDRKINKQTNQVS
jgi:hypothetical protein